MPINENTTLPNRHTLYLACTGAGKSQAMLQNKEIPKRGVRSLIWDPDCDHDAIRFNLLSEFKQALIKAIKSGKGFRLAFSGDDTKTNFNKWCELVWKSLDGNHLTYIHIEESAQVLDSTGRESGFAGQIARQSRKYGGVLHVATTSPAEIPKTITRACQTKYVGQQDPADIKTVCNKVGLLVDQVGKLQPLQFILKQPGQENKLIKLKYKPKK